MSESNKNCHQAFTHCKHANRIKQLLKEYSNILSNKSMVSEYHLQIEVHTMIEKNQYSNTKLLNDFYHIEYNHNTNDDPKQFELFYRYLVDDNTFMCNINHCKTVQRRYKRINNRLTFELETEHYNYDQDIVTQLIQMDVGTKDEIISASKQTINYHNINDVLDTIHNITDDSDEIEIKYSLNLISR
eukprot:424575_1